MPDPFIASEDLVAYLGRGTAGDPGMIIACDAACDVVRTFTEQDFNEGTSTVVLDGTGTDCVLLPQRPVTNAGTVNVAGSSITDYVVADNGRLIRQDASSPASVVALTWPEGRQNVEVTYDHGYSDDDIPRDVRMVALSLAARLIVQGPAIREQIGDRVVQYAGAATELTSTERMILSKYRQIR